MESETGPPPWYSKCFEYLRNRNRISPGNVELSDCDFFIVESKRTLRILRPTLKSGKFYENTDHERPESLNDNFFSRWSRRPHPSGNCRCSFRQQWNNRVSTTEEEIISAEINRIRTSLCEAKTGEEIAEIEKRVSLTLENLRVTNDEQQQKIRDEKIFDKDVSVKNKIVRDLESYINDLLEEIMSDTIKFISEAGNSLDRKLRSNEDKHCEKKTMVQNSQTKIINNFEINFAFPDEKMEITTSNDGYVNPAFDGTTREPDALNFYLRRQLGTEIILEQLDCIDSGINSVETVELQQEQEPSLEESLLEIIDAKLGRTSINGNKNWDELENITNLKDSENLEKNRETFIKDEKTQSIEKEISAIKKTEILEKSIDNVDSLQEDFREFEDHVDDESFERLRLEFKESTSTPKAKTKRITAFKDKLISHLNSSNKNNQSLKNSSSNLSLELKDYNKNWSNFEVPSNSFCQDPNDFVVFRRNRKPTIVFIHGFGSSAEIFSHQLEYFSNLGYPCIAPDLLGHGMSSASNRSGDYHFEKLLQDLDLVLHHYAFKPEQKCVLVAHNYGCSFATALACKYESSIHQLVLISGGGPTPLAPPSNETAGHCCLRAMLTPFLVCGLHRDILYSARGRQHPYCGFEESEEQWPSHMKYVLKGMSWPEGDYVFHRRICTPTLLIHGLRDNKVSLVQECQMERTMIKAFLEALPSAGHIPMTDCPNQINHMIHCFIDLWKNKRW